MTGLPVASLAQELAPEPPAKAKPPEPKPAVDENILRAYRQQRDSLRQQFNGVAELKDATLGELVQFSQRKGVLQMQAALPAVMNATGQTQQRVKIPGINAGWQFTRYQSRQSVMGPNGRVLQGVISANVQRVELGEKNDEEVYQTNVSSSGTSFSVSAVSVLGRVTFYQNTAMRNANLGGRANAQPVTLTVTELQGRGQAKSVFRGSARTVEELRSQYPEEFRKYLLPALARVTDVSFLLPGAAEVYAVFPEIAPDPRATARVEALLPELDSDAFEIREAASRQLLDQGESAVAAALRLDRDLLSDEQKGQLGKLINAHRRREMPEVAEARKDANFLADCLEHDDPAVRAAARGQLELLLGVPVAFDPALKGEARGQAVDGVRKQIQAARISAAASGAATQPATQPSTQPAGRPSAGARPAADPLLR